MPVEATAQLVQGLPNFWDENLLVGAEHFSDAGVYRLADKLAIVQSLDFFPPVVDDPYVYGQIAAANSLGDIYATGARPITALNIVGFPDDELSLDILQGILNGGGERVQAAGAVLVGGHSVRDTEIKYGLSATGVVDPERMMSNRQAKEGDHLVLTKALGTGFITTAHRARRCPTDILETACASMIQLNQKASQLAVELGARGATDVTGFGLAGHAFEMAEASGVTVRIHLDHLPRLPGASELAQRGYHSRANQSNRNFVEPSSRIEGQPDEIDLQFLFDPQTSGGLLIALDPDSAEQLVARCREEGLADTALIGEVLGKEKVTLVID